MWVRKEEAGEFKDKPDAVTFGKSMWLAFGVVFVAEWGDLTQIATAGFAARLKAPVLVFAASTTALWAVATIAVTVGHRAGRLLNPDLTRKVAARAVRRRRHPADHRRVLDRFQLEVIEFSPLPPKVKGPTSRRLGGGGSGPSPGTYRCRPPPRFAQGEVRSLPPRTITSS